MEMVEIFIFLCYNEYGFYIHAKEEPMKAIITDLDRTLPPQNLLKIGICRESGEKI